MSLPPTIQCRSGCGDVGDPELDFLCVDCHGDRVEARRERELQHYVAGKKTAAATAAHGSTSGGAAAPSPTRRGPPSINHQQDAKVVDRENQFLERELQIRETSKLQLRKYMVATDEGEPVDPKDWSRYKYGAPRDVPHNDVDEATEFAAQIKLFCYWRKRTLRQRIESKRQLLGAADKERSQRQSSTAAQLFGSSFKTSSKKKLSMTETAIARMAKLKAPEKAREAHKRASLLMSAWPTNKPLAT